MLEIEPVLPGDPDYKFVKKRMKNAKYVTFDELMKLQKTYRKNNCPQE